jgi:hypothetical protein
LVPEDGGEEFYVTLDWSEPVQPWVEQNVIPYLDMVPQALVSSRMAREDAARELSTWLTRELESHLSSISSDQPQLEIVADWPEDISQICSLLTIGPGLIVDVPPLTFRFVHLQGFSTAANSKVPHNALHDARALRDHVLSFE